MSGLRNPADERQVVVTLTDQGRDMQARSLGPTLFTSANMTVEKPVQLNKDVQAFRESVSRFVDERTEH